MALKLDMSKAYDRVEWGFLESILRVMGFSDRWIGLTLSCVNSVRYHIINSGQKLGPIIPTRGIRQGCPLSPYLFIVCAKGFLSLIRHYEATRLITGCKVARSAPTISHLLFADDSYVYCQALEEEASHVLLLLQTFEGASGQKVNLHKSSAFFSSNTATNTRNSICNMMHIQEAVEDSMYLGLPSIVGQNKNAVLGFLKERMRKRINGWEGRFLSRAGKEILIKTVVQSLPSYAMNVFLLPIGTCNEIERMMASFWWKSNNSNGNGSGITWMSWDRMTKHKYDGGMGFRSLRDFNLAMLGKQRWRLLFNIDSLASKVFKARYFPHGDYLSAELGSNPSFICSSIFAAKDTVKLGLRKRISPGTSVQITNDPWLPSLDHSALAPMVQDAAIILGIPIDQSGEVDSWYWVAEKNGSKRFFLLFVPGFEATTSRVTKGDASCNNVVLGFMGRETIRYGSKWVRRVSDVVAFANLSLDQWINAQGKGNIPLLSPLKDGDGAEQWIKPSSGIKDGSRAPRIGQIIGIVEALNWLKDNAYTRAIIETDSLVCVEAIHST
uniref:Reverse transcriptase domain-containing protein n=1 Tax=Cannabis sativa TaxID=3483 RepID=A0A803PQG5_CANSA